MKPLRDERTAWPHDARRVIYGGVLVNDTKEKTMKLEWKVWNTGEFRALTPKV